MPDSSEKYATFKRDDVIKVSDGYATFPIGAEIPDAVVIRRQDKFASPALATYAAMIAVAVSLIEDPVQRTNLLQVADYFEHQAQLAADEGRKIPDV
jgi:hypothetical protein